MAAKRKGGKTRKGAKRAKKASPKVRTARRSTARPAAVARKKLQPRRQPESLRLRSAGPSFTVDDIEKSLAYYRDVLGFTEKERWETDGALHGVELVAGRVTFWIGQDDWKKGRDRVKGQGFRIYCGTAQDIDALAAGVRARGGALAEGPRDEPWGGRAFAVVDPDGFTITFASE